MKATLLEDEDLGDDDEELGGDVGAFMETALLEKIAHKLVLLTDITIQKQGRETVFLKYLFI